MACKAAFDKTAINDCYKQTKGDWKPLGFSFESGKNGVGMMNANDDLIVEVSPHAQIIDLTRETLSRLKAPTAPVAPLPPMLHVEPVAPVPPVPPQRIVGSRSPGSSVIVSGGMVPENATRNRKVRNEKYEGLAVHVERSVDTIASGAIGNSKAIESTYEQYYSLDLKMNVYVRRSDPRHGESLYRMTDIKRTDPDANTFKVPSGYAVTEGKK